MSPTPATGSTVRKVKRKAGKARRETMDADWTSYVGRVGLASRGVTYLIVAALAVRIAVTPSTDTEADRRGAFEALSSAPLGRVALAVLAAGFACYAAWRLVQAGLNPERRGRGQRLASLTKGLLYGSFFVSALTFVVQDKQDGDNDRVHQDHTARVLEWPAGRYLVIAVGVGFFGAAAWNAYRAASGRYRKHLKDAEISTDGRGWITAVACAGLVARAVVCASIGYFLVRTGIQADPSDTVGLDGSLRRIAGGPGGPLFLTLLAAGLAAYGGWSFVEARYRRIFGD